MRSDGLQMHVTGTDRCLPQDLSENNEWLTETPKDRAPTNIYHKQTVTKLSSTKTYQESLAELDPFYALAPTPKSTRNVKERSTTNIHRVVQPEYDHATEIASTMTQSYASKTRTTQERHARKNRQHNTKRLRKWNGGTTKNNNHSQSTITEQDMTSTPEERNEQPSTDQNQDGNPGSMEIREEQPSVLTTETSVRPNSIGTEMRSALTSPELDRKIRVRILLPNSVAKRVLRTNHAGPSDTFTVQQAKVCVVTAQCHNSTIAVTGDHVNDVISATQIIINKAYEYAWMRARSYGSKELLDIRILLDDATISELIGHAGARINRLRIQHKFTEIKVFKPYAPLDKDTDSKERVAKLYGPKEEVWQAAEHIILVSAQTPAKPKLEFIPSPTADVSSRYYRGYNTTLVFEEEYYEAANFAPPHNRATDRPRSKRQRTESEPGPEMTQIDATAAYNTAYIPRRVYAYIPRDRVVINEESEDETPNIQRASTIPNSSTHQVQHAPMERLQTTPPLDVINRICMPTGDEGNTRSAEQANYLINQVHVIGDSFCTPEHFFNRRAKQRRNGR